MITFCNPRLHAEFDNWPSGGKRVKCIFHVHHDKRGYRFSRITTGKPKYSTYSGQACIVDGSDGRTYLLQVAAGYGFIMVHRSDFMNATKEMGGKCSVWEKTDPELYKQLANLILESGAVLQPVS